MLLRVFSLVAVALASVTAQATGGGNQTTGCPAGSFILPTNTTYTCVTACPRGTFSYMNYCVAACPTGTTLTNNTACVAVPSASATPRAVPSVSTTARPVGTNGTNPAYSLAPTPAPLTCDKLLPGSLTDPNTGECFCGADAWIVRNPTGAPPLAACVPMPPANNTNGIPLPPVNCGSFTPGLVFVPFFGDCQCAPTAPYLLPNPNDRLFPYACAVTVDATLGLMPLRCNTTQQYFSVFAGGCQPLPPPPTPSQSAAPLPSASADPVRPSPSEMPSMSAPPTQPSSDPIPSPSEMPSKSADPVRPSPSELPTMSAPPTQPSSDPIPSRSAAPIPSPSEMPSKSADPVRPSPSELPSKSAYPSRPAPTQMPSFAPAQRSAAPTPPPIRRSIAPTQRPTTVQNTLRLPGAALPTNQTATGPAVNTTIQNIQAALACSLRVPPEQVTIRNITVTTAAGTVWNPAIPPQLAANGTIVCYNTTAATAPAPRLLRALATTDTGIAVDYTVDAPPDAALSSADLTAALSTSPMMVDVAAAVGATGVTATTDAAIAETAPAPAPASANDASQSTVVIVSGIGAAMAALAISAVVILGVLYIRRPQAAAATAVPPSKSRTVIVVETQAVATTTTVNPMASATATAERTAFEPTQRTRV